ncbi:MAG: ATP-dependent RecD-like DNA helicase [Lachnospiraceae bacterium]|nr:ATP-dependent RecD-like DNA helicase [Lachnospiraceae bacterium]
METFSGYVEKIVYRNDDNGYTVLSVSFGDEEIVCVGTFQFINEGEYVSFEGKTTSHPSYGEQFSVSSYHIREPEDEKAVLKYLSSGAIKGVGNALAARIVKKFGEDTFRIIEEEPERLKEVKGISERMAAEIAEQLEEKKDMRKAMIFMQELGISSNMAVKIYNKYGYGVYEIIKKNPYRLAEDIDGIGFKIADEIAVKAGITPDSDFRIKCGILYILNQAGLNGHSYLPYGELVGLTRELLLADVEDIDGYLVDMQIDKRIVIKTFDNIKCIYSSTAYYTELNIAHMLNGLNKRSFIEEGEILTRISQIESGTGIILDELQKRAVIEAMNSGLLIVTGGPGTGKTTTINTIIRMFENQGMEILLAAPTGRAAKRMAEATGRDATTIHRLLEIAGNPDETGQGTHFERNEQNPLEADAVIIDEMSMVDMYLMHALLKAVAVGTRLVLVGDVNQLPSVGPGNVLKDIINSHCFNVVMLKKVFRQAALSDIIMNAHKINDGEMVSLDNKSKDFLFVKRNDANAVINAVITLVKEKLPRYVEAEVLDVQVLTPMRKGALGVINLNKVLQEFINPPSEKKRERVYGEVTFREGDKVMQIKNNYQMAWEIRGARGIVTEQGMGVFNGDVGIIKNINLFMENMEVQFDDGKFVSYSFKQLEELELAYAVTIHKSQGSEYPAVVLPLITGPRMLMTRNLLYTAVTRAKKCVTIVGVEDAVKEMVANNNEVKRHSGLGHMITNNREEA